MLESWFFYAIWTTYQRWFPENFVKICLILTSKISFEKFRKNINFWKSLKKFGQNGWREISFFFTFSELLGPKEKREGETFQEIWKKVKITAPYCAHRNTNKVYFLYNSVKDVGTGKAIVLYTCTFNILLYKLFTESRIFQKLLLKIQLDFQYSLTLIYTGDGKVGLTESHSSWTASMDAAVLAVQWAGWLGRFCGFAWLAWVWLTRVLLAQASLAWTALAWVLLA
jgi:hypothetical protein